MHKMERSLTRTVLRRTVYLPVSFFAISTIATNYLRMGGAFQSSILCILQMNLEMTLLMMLN